MTRLNNCYGGFYYSCACLFSKYYDNDGQERQRKLDDHKTKIRNRIHENEIAYEQRQQKLEEKLAPVRSIVFNLGLEPTNQDINNFIDSISDIKIINHNFFFDTLRAGYEIIVSSDLIDIEHKKKAKLALARIGVYIK